MSARRRRTVVDGVARNWADFTAAYDWARTLPAWTRVALEIDEGYGTGWRPYDEVVVGPAGGLLDPL